MLRCPNSNCENSTRDKSEARSLGFRKKGYFSRSGNTKHHHRKVARYQCKACGKYFSSATLSKLYRQRRPDINADIVFLLCSGISQRRLALRHKVSRQTVVAKFLLGAEDARIRHEAFLNSQEPLPYIQFDEVQTFEHTKCKPVSIVFSVSPNGRKILSATTCSMPATGLLAAIARKRYGPRDDDRAATIREVLTRLKDVVTPNVNVLTDRCTLYPSAVRECWPEALHKTVKGRRGCVVGQGELKRGGFDPLFALNHTAAMVRANMNRMMRRTWCTTKKMCRLQAHLYLYIDFHNNVLTA